MSILAIASAYDSPQRSAALPRAGEGRVDAAAEPAGARSDAAARQRRHPLMDAMANASGLRERRSSDKPIERAAAAEDALKSDAGGADEAVARFAHALMNDLRQLGGGDAAQGWSDLGLQVSTLAAKAGAGAAQAPEVPPQPDPLTPTSAAVHLMQVPSSQLLEAYAALRQALPSADAAAGGEGDEGRAGLAGFLERMSQSLGPQAPYTGLGHLLDARA